MKSIMQGTNSSSGSSICTPKRMKLIVIMGLVKIAVVYCLFFYGTLSSHHVELSTERPLKEDKGAAADADGAAGKKRDPVAKVFGGTSEPKTGDHLAEKEVKTEAVQQNKAETTLLQDSSSFIFAVMHLEGYGNLKWKLFPNDAPKTVENFVKLAKNSIFDGTCLYRYEAGFVLQGGGGGSIGRRASPYGTIPLEHKLPNKKWSIAMARTGDPNSATMEFFVNLNDNSHWLGAGGATKEGYAVFGEVIEGFEAIEAMGKKPTKKEGLTMFVDPVKITKVEIQ